MSYTLKQKASDVEKAIEIALTSGPVRMLEITLYAANWLASGDGTYYIHDLTIENSTANTKVDLSPTPEQFISLLSNEITMFVANDAGIIRAYSIGDVPTTDITMTALVSEVVYA